MRISFFHPAWFVVVWPLTMVLLFAPAALAQTAACCCGDQCDVLDEVGCDAWGATFDPPRECNLLAAADCSGEPCATGACCLGIICEDDGGYTGPLCEGAGGLFHGGIGCAAATCNACPFEDAQHCQQDSDGYIYLADREVGRRRIDDFIAQAGGIARVCAWMCYTGDTQECAGAPPDDWFHIRFYDSVNGLPGSELGFFDVGEPDDAVPVLPVQGRCWQVTWPIDPPLMEGVDYDAGDCLWLEITGYGDGPDCRVFWQESLEGNRSGISDEFEPLADPTMPTPIGGFDYTDLHQVWRWGDLAFCIDSGISPATVPGVIPDGGCGDLPAACCGYDGDVIACQDGLTISSCQASRGAWYPSVDCAFVQENVVGCYTPPNDACEDAIDVNAPGQPCHDQQVDPDLGRCDGRGIDGDSDEGCMLPDGDGAEDCRNSGDRCLPWPNDGYYCEVPVNNRLATTDGDPAGGTPPGGYGCQSGANSFQADVWYKYVAPCHGELAIFTCDDQTFDMMMGVYRYDPADCPPTNNTNLLACSDDYCHNPVVVIDVMADEELLIRVGGWSSAGGPGDAGQGASELEISVFCAVPIEPPLVPFDSTDALTKGRYLSFAPNNEISVAFRVTLPDGRTGWVGEPAIRGWPNSTDDRAAVSLVVAEPVYRVWTEAVVHVTGCVVAPARTYLVDAYENVSFTSSESLAVVTTPAPGVGSWADIVGDFDNGSQSWSPANGFVNFQDIDAAVKKFQVSPTAPHVTVVDLHPQWPNYVVNFSDIDMVIKGFQGVGYPVPVSDCETIANCPLGGEAGCLP